MIKYYFCFSCTIGRDVLWGFGWAIVFHRTRWRPQAYRHHFFWIFARETSRSLHRLPEWLHRNRLFSQLDSRGQGRQHLSQFPRKNGQILFTISSVLCLREIHSSKHLSFEEMQHNFVAVANFSTNYCLR
jgi:hypothetical protein